MSTIQTDLNGDNIVPCIRKKIRLNGEYYLCIGNNHISDNFMRYIQHNGTIIFEPINEVK